MRHSLTFSAITATGLISMRRLWDGFSRTHHISDVLHCLHQAHPKPGLGTNQGPWTNFKWSPACLSNKYTYIPSSLIISCTRKTCCIDNLMTHWLKDQYNCTESQATIVLYVIYVRSGWPPGIFTLSDLIPIQKGLDTPGLRQQMTTTTHAVFGLAYRVQAWVTGCYLLFT